MKSRKVQQFGAIDYILRNLRASKLRTYLTISGIAVCVALFILFNAVGEGVNQYIAGQAGERGAWRYNEMAEILDSWLNIINSVLIITLAVAVANTMLIAVSQRQKELGTLKALGLVRRQIRELILLEALIITGIAFIIGCILGIALAWGCDYLYLFSRNNGFSLSWFFAPTRITPKILISAAFLSVIAGTLAALYPALRAEMLSPAEALRYE